MDDFIHAYCEELTKDTWIATAKTIYQIATTEHDNSDEVAKELAYFFHMCGNSRFNFYAVGNPAHDRAYQILRKCRTTVLPQHNAVAFFQKFMGLKEELSPKEMYFMLNHLLPYTLAGHGFVFGTIFPEEGVNCIHPCDLKYIDLPTYNREEQREIRYNILRSQAELRAGRSFSDELAFYTNIVMHLSLEKRQIEKWLKEAGNKDTEDSEPVNSDHQSKPWAGDIEEHEEMFWNFFEIYRNYYKNQASQDGRDESNGDTTFPKKITEELDRLKKAAQTFFNMERMLRRLENILKIEDQESNICAKAAWLEEIQTEMSTPEMQSGIRVLKGLFQDKDNEVPELYELLATGNKPSKRQREQYPILDKQSPINKLGKKEGGELRWHRKSTVARIIGWLCRGAGKLSLRKVMPFYLLDLFSNDGKPLRPFKRRPNYFRPDKMKFQGEITFSTHPDRVRKHESDYRLYQDLLAWCDRYFKGEWDRSLCNALYTFYRRHLVLQRPSAATNFLGNDLAVLKKAIRYMFDMSPAMFPQRTQLEITMNEFYDFFNYNTDPDVKTVRKTLEKLITEKDVEEYKELAFLDAHGFGYSFHPSEWRDKIENWLIKIEERDKRVMEYIKDSERDADLHQAQIDLAIQFVCCRKVQESMTQEVLRFCKQIFSPCYK